MSKTKDDLATGHSNNEESLSRAPRTAENLMRKQVKNAYSSVNSSVEIAQNSEKRDGSLVISRNKIKLIQKSKSRGSLEKLIKTNEKEGNDQRQELASANSSIENSVSKLKINKHSNLPSM